MTQKPSRSCRISEDERCCVRQYEHLTGRPLDDDRQALIRIICTLGGYFTQQELVAAVRDAGLELTQHAIHQLLPLLEEAGIIRRTSVYQRISPGPDPTLLP